MNFTVAQICLARSSSAFPCAHVGSVQAPFQGIPCAVCFSFALKEAAKWKIFRSSKRQKGNAFVFILIFSHHCCLFQWSVFQCLPCVSLCFQVRAAGDSRRSQGASSAMCYLSRCVSLAFPPPKKENCSILK